MISIRNIIFLTMLSILVAGALSHAQAQEDFDRTGSPYFFIKSDDPDVDQLPLKSTAASVTISGVIADVTVTQVYRNEGKRPMEAVYVFPASTRAAVYGMKMIIGKRTIVAKIAKRDEARQAYEQAKQDGRSVSLLEQQRPNVFQMNVANILPGDRIAVELKYTELLVAQDKEYEFVYPTVVGPRYVSQGQSESASSEAWSANPHLRQGTPPTYTFDISLKISTGLAIKGITCPSHRVDIQYKSPSQASLTLDKSESQGGNRDFICKYRLAGKRIESGLVLSQGERENFFLLMVQPPTRLAQQDIPPREYVFIVDVSGSMHGFPLDITKRLLKDIIGNLRPTDRFNVLLFSGGSQLMSEQSVPADARNIRTAIATIDNQQGGGGTELLPALNRALSLPGATGFSRTFIIVTDGYVSVEAEAFDLIRNNLGRANMFAFGIGSSVNRHLIEGIARMGMGEPFMVTSPENAAKTSENFRRLVSYPALRGIDIDYEGFDAYDIEPPSIPDVLSDRPVIVFGKWRGRPSGTIRVKGMTGNSRYSETIDVHTASRDTASSALCYLWARHRIMMLSDYSQLGRSEERAKEVTALGLKYNLLTAYTSFVAIDSEKRSDDSSPATVRQPLPLPQGVSDLAVGGYSACRQVTAPACSKLLGSETKDEGSPGTVESSGQNRKAPGIQLIQVSTPANMNADAARVVLERHLSSIRSCLAGTPMNRGECTLKFTIEADGRVSGVDMEPVHQGVKKCLSVLIRSLWFHRPIDGKRSVVTCLFRAG